MSTTKELVLAQLIEQEDWVSGAFLSDRLSVSRETIWKVINTLRKEGVEIISRKKLGYKYLASNFLNADIINFYSNNRFKDDLHAFKRTGSTQELAKEYLNNKRQVNEPIIFAADQQDNGYGRRGRHFYSPARTGLYFSMILPNSIYNLDNIGLLTTSIAVLVVRVLERFFTDKEFELKWVNDIYLDNYKVGGIITEANIDLETQSSENFIVGIGLNLTTQDFPDDLKVKAHSIDSKVKVDRNLLASELFKEIADNYLDYKNPDLLNQYRKRSLLIGKKVTLQLGTKVIEGQVIAIADSGALVLKDEYGEQKKFDSGEVVKVNFV